jgi:hypothetical protein
MNDQARALSSTSGRSLRLACVALALALAMAGGSCQTPPEDDGGVEVKRQAYCGEDPARWECSVCEPGWICQ